MRGIRVGRLFGVDLRIDWSWVLIVVLLTWNLSAVFSAWHPSWSPFQSLLVSLSASLVFFLCILLHELAHSLVAMAYGTRVRSITLFLFGGVSDIEREPRSAAAEFFTAIVGPLTSLLLGLLFILLTALLTPLSSLAAAEEGRAVLARLGPIHNTAGVARPNQHWDWTLQFDSRLSTRRRARLASGALEHHREPTKGDAMGCGNGASHRMALHRGRYGHDLWRARPVLWDRSREWSVARLHWLVSLGSCGAGNQAPRAGRYARRSHRRASDADERRDCTARALGRPRSFRITSCGVQIGRFRSRKVTSCSAWFACPTFGRSPPRSGTRYRCLASCAE